MTRLETRAENRGVILMALVLGGLVVWTLFQYGVLKVTAGNPLG